MTHADSTRSFSNRAENYVRFRPGYPPEVIAYLTEHAGLTPQAVLADVGAGNGKLTELLLQNGNPVFAVEPNEEMRAYAERLLGDHPNFTSVAASAEATTLPDHSIEMVLAAQAFHWFDQDKAKVEFRRILKPGGVAALIWNERDVSSPMVAAYDEIASTYGNQYKEVVHTYAAQDEAIAAFFAPNAVQTASFPYSQSFDLEGLRGRLLSASYAPQPGEPGHAPMLAALDALFGQYEEDGAVEFAYLTKVYWGEFLRLRSLRLRSGQGGQAL
jgi:ubiquinone/menaquinone biosynthesis C-methylase UbiE